MRKSDDTKVEAQPIPIDDQLLSQAEDATTQEHHLTLRSATRLYPKAIAWSILMSSALIMDGYDFKLIGSLFAQPAFAKAYGKRQSNGTYQIPAAWQTGLNNGSNIGQMIGLLIAGYIVERFGFRKTMLGAVAVVPCFIFIQFFAKGLPQLEAGQVLLGIPLGIFQTISCVYAAEITPVCLRAYLTSYVSGCWLVGQLIASGTLRGTLDMESSLAYRIPFAIQWFWPIPLLVGALLAPESPWWLVRQNRIDDARRSIERLTSVVEGSNFAIDKSVALMVVTTEHERKASASTTYLSCFRGTDLRRTLVVMGCYCITVSSGSTVRAYATYFLQQAGLPTDQAFNMSIVLYALGVLGLIGTWLLIPHFGRRTIFLYGQIVMTAILFAVGGIGVAQKVPGASADLAWGVGALLMLSSFVANLAISPVLYALVTELPSSLLRSKSVVIARFTYAVVNVIANVITPYQLNPSAWDWGAMSGFFWGGLCFLGCVFTYLCVPEPMGRTVAELDLLFARRLSARKFSKTVVRWTDLVETGQGESTAKTA